jgi:hemoglobin
MSTLPIVPAILPAEGIRSASAPQQALVSPGNDLTEADLHPLLVEFYRRIAGDALVAPYFADLDMSAHLPRIVDFWSTLLFRTGRYTGNAFRPHLEMPGLTGEHFDRWLATLEATLDASYAGPNTDSMKSFAHRIAYSMQVRLGIFPTEGSQINRR